MNIVLGKLGISLAAIVLLIIVISQRKKISAWLENKSVRVSLIIGWIIFRLIPFVAIYLIANITPTSDVLGFWDEGSKASMGQIVYRDFWSPYSPLYAYFVGIWLKLWYDPKMIVLTMAVMDGVALWVSWHFFRPFQSRGSFLFKALVYLILPGSLVLCIIGAQEDVWMWLFVVLAYLVREKTVRVEWFAVVLGIGLLMTKAIFVLILIPIFLLEKHKIRFVIPMAIVGIIALGILYPLVGLDFMQPLDEAKVLRAPNILAIINPWFFNGIGVGEKFWNWIGLVVSVGLACIAAFRLQNADFRIMLSRVWVVLYATMMVVQQSAYSNYIFLFLIPLVFYVIDWTNKKQIILLLIFNVLCVVHPSYWWRLGMPRYLKPADITASTDLIIDYIFQISIIVLTGYFVWLAFPKKQTRNQFN
ncbi:MAG: hypothetical protein ABIN24_11860 [Dyadobacter sp.]